MLLTKNYLFHFVNTMQYNTILMHRTGVGVTTPISSVPLFSYIFKYCQIWMWFKESNIYFCEIENFAYGEINERRFDKNFGAVV